MPIRILIADDHGVVAEGLRMIIEAQPGMVVLACLQDSTEAVRQTKALRPDVVIIDHGMPELNGTEAAELIVRSCPDTRIIILSMHSNQVHVVRALQAGALGYVVKRSAAAEVVAAVRSVYEGKRYVSIELMGKVLNHVTRNNPLDDPVHLLSLRERQVLQMLVEGHAVHEIAKRISLSPKTIETYRARMMEKLDIHDIPNLVRFAIQHGIASLD